MIGSYDAQNVWMEKNERHRESFVPNGLVITWINGDDAEEHSVGSLSYPYHFYKFVGWKKEMVERK